MAAPYPLLQSPLPGYIEPRGATWDGGRFGVVSTLAEHIASGRAPGTDIANYPTTEGAPVRLMRAGVCYQKYRQPYHNPPQIGDGALICRFRDAAGNHGYAHLSAFGSISVGYSYPAGKVVGYVGKTGTAKPHLHTHWQTPDGRHHEVYYQMEQSRNLQFNSTVEGVRIRATPGLSGAIIGTVGAAGIKNATGKVVASRSATLVRRHVVHVAKDGYWWEPIAVGGLSGWTARNFIHFI